MIPLQYDPEHPVDPVEWLALDESERIELVRQYHRQNRIRLPNETLHALTHVIVENQAALGETFVTQAVLLRLMHEGLDRHEAIHAMGSVLAEQLVAAFRQEDTSDDLGADYAKGIEALTADSWRKQVS
jgi:hypothetical protein